MSTSSKGPDSSDRGFPLWRSLLHSLRENIPAASVDELYRSCVVLGPTLWSLNLAVPRQPLRAWLDDGRLRVLSTVLSRLTDGRCALIVVPADLPVDLPGRASPHPGLTLETFIPSPSNEEIRDQITALARGLDGPGRPILLHGPPGSGKTHLLHALAHTRPSAPPTLLLSSEDLSLDLVAAIRAHTLGEFRERLQGSVLLLDDVQLLEGRKASQKELCRALEQRQPLRLFVTARTPPGIQNLEPALRGHLTEAMHLELHKPEWETTLAIVLERIARWSIDPHPDAPGLIAGALRGDLRQLDTLLTRVLTHPLAEGDLSDPSRIRKILTLRPERVSPLPADAILSVVARHFNLRISDLRSTARSPRVSTPRQLAIYLVREHCGLSYPEIGRRFRRHHTTALHSVRRIQHLREQNSSMNATLNLLEKELERLADSSE